RSRAHPVFFSQRFERTRSSAPPRTSLQRGGRAGGRAAPTRRRAHLSVLAATLRRAARGRGADPLFLPRTLQRDWRDATSILFHWPGDSRSHLSDVRSELHMGRAGPSQAGRQSTHGRTATSAALRPIRQGGPATLSEGRAPARTESGGHTKG